MLHDFCSFSLAWDPMGEKIFKKATPPTNRSPKFSTFPNFILVNDPHKTALGVFEIEILTNVCRFR